MAKRWTEEEKQLIIKLRNEGLTAKEMVPHFENRTEATIKNLAAKLAPKNNKWTVEEDLLLEELFLQGLSDKAISYSLPNRTAIAVRSRINTLFISSGRFPKRRQDIEWSREKTEVLIKMREEGCTYEQIAEATNTNASKVSHEMVKLIAQGKIEPKIRHIEWTEEEEALLCDLRSQGLNIEQIAKQLNRTRGSVANHSSRLIKAGVLDPFTSINRDTPCKLYLVYFYEESFYKVGITQNDIGTRFKGYPKYEIIDVLTFDSLTQAKEIEARLLNLMKPFQYIPLEFKYGSTECFQLKTAPSGILDLVSYT